MSVCLSRCLVLSLCHCLSPPRRSMSSLSFLSLLMSCNFRLSVIISNPPPLLYGSVILSSFLPLTLCVSGCPLLSPVASVSLSLSCILAVSPSLCLFFLLCHVLSVSFSLIITRPPLCTLLIGTILILTVFICLVIKRFLEVGRWTTYIF